MANPLPWFKFYAADWWGDEAVRLMSPAQRGVYADLLARQWIEGSVPADAAAVAQLLGAEISDVEAVLEGHFKRRGRRSRNRRLATQRTESLAAREAMSQGGSKRPRRGKQPPREAPSVESESDPESDSESRIDATASREGPLHRVLPDWCGKCVENGPRMGFDQPAGKPCERCKRGRMRAAIYRQSREAEEAAAAAKADGGGDVDPAGKAKVDAALRHAMGGGA